MANKNLTGQTIAESYDQLLLSADEGGVTGQTSSATQIICGTGTAGAGNIGTTPLYLSRDNVGIGTATPHSTLHISSATAQIRITDSDELDGDGSGNGLYIQQNGDVSYFINREADKMHIGTSNSTDLTIDADGNVGIGATSPEGILHLEDGNTDQNLVFDGGNSASASNAGFIIESRNDANNAREDLTIQGDPVVLQPSSGNVGIGTANPLAPLHIHATAGILRLSDSNSTNTTDAMCYIDMFDNENDNLLGRIGYLSESVMDLGIYNALAGDINFSTAGTEKMTILTGGNVGIGIASPTSKLHIDQAAADGAVPVLKLDQADVDDSFIDFVGTTAADQTRSLSTDTSVGALTGHIKIEINGSPFWLAYYAAN